MGIFHYSWKSAAWIQSIENISGTFSIVGCREIARGDAILAGEALIACANSDAIGSFLADTMFARIKKYTTLCDM